MSKTPGPSRRVNKSRKREHCLEWDEYFMATAFLAAKRSKDPLSQVGACIVNEKKIILGTGYNGMPRGCPDDQFPWNRKKENPDDNKHLYVCHAALNAILNKNSQALQGSTIYASIFPCNECAKLIIQSGIKEVVYMSEKHEDRSPAFASRRMLKAANIKCRSFVPKNPEITINFYADGPFSNIDVTKDFSDILASEDSSEESNEVPSPPPPQPPTSSSTSEVNDVK